MAQIRGLVCDGVWLTLRSGGTEYGGMQRVVRAISNMYEVFAGQTVTSIFEDDKNCAIYEVDLAGDASRWVAKQFVDDIREVFREAGGYNRLTIRHKGYELLSDDPWWPDDLQDQGDFF